MTHSLSPFRATIAPLLLAIMFAMLTAPATAAPQAPEKKVLVIGIDGLRLDALERAHTPVLDGLIGNGVLSEARILGPRYRGNDTVSGPGRSSILTGVWADKHGVGGNGFETPGFEAYPYFFARVKAAKSDAVTISLASWALIDAHIVSAADVHAVIANPGGPADEASVQARLDDMMRDVASALLRSMNSAAMFAYFHQADGVGHAIGYGPDVPEYIREVENIDADIGALLEAVAATPSYPDEDWLILITTDHGGAGTGHGGGHDNPDVAQSLLIASRDAIKDRAGAGSVDIVDLVPTALDHLGIAIDPLWRLDGQSLLSDRNDRRPRIQ